MPPESKRFYTQTGFRPTRGGFHITLDGRVIKTPAKAELIVPTAALARHIAQEWDAQGETITPNAMPATRMANSAIDKVMAHQNTVIEMIADYGETELLCYRSATPIALQNRQETAWDPLLAWAKNQYNLQFNVTTGLMPITQPDGHRARLLAILARYSVFELAAVHDLVTISGSFVLGLAQSCNYISVDAAWNSAHIDEIWQAEHWGSDSDALKSAQKKRTEIEHAKVFFDLSQFGTKIKF